MSDKKEIRIQGVAPQKVEAIKAIAQSHGVSIASFLKIEISKIIEQHMPNKNAVC